MVDVWLNGWMDGWMNEWMDGRKGIKDVRE